MNGKKTRIPFHLFTVIENTGEGENVHLSNFPHYINRRKKYEAQD